MRFTSSQEMLDACRADGSYERTIVDLMDDAIRRKTAARYCMKALVELKKFYIKSGKQGDETEFQLLQAAIDNLSEGDLRIVPMDATP